MTRLALVVALLLPAPLSAQGSGAGGPAPRGGTERIPAGGYVPLYARDGAAVRVAPFDLDRHPVTRADFLEFARANPEWRRSRIRPVYTEDGYLADWRSDLDAGEGDAARRPVTRVSWFAARAYCGWRGKRLPTVDEWEYTAAASEDRPNALDDAAFKQRLLDLYTRPRQGTPPQVGSGFRNHYGIHDLHGLVREWVLDFNSAMVSDDSRGTGARDRQLTCASGASGATDVSDYAAFLRYAFRASLGARSTVDNLGFRCARSVQP